ncbi:MAG: hypothetical protein IT162_09200 [Bryobacterales bacterium]|nr:hypothetical protein [Bryobacterales bacterium]
MAKTDEFVSQLSDLINEFDGLRAGSKHDDCSDVMSDVKAIELATRSCAAIERIAGRNSSYWLQADSFRTNARHYEQLKACNLIGVLSSLRADLRAGHLVSLQELVHAEVFSDSLEMADHLVDTGYKDAAAVIAGSSLRAGSTLAATGQTLERAH